MKKVFVYIIWAFILCAIYIILREEFTLLAAGIGFLLSFAALVFTDKVLSVDTVSVFSINLYYIPFVFYLLFSIIKAGCITVFYIITGKTTVHFIEHESKLRDAQLLNMLSNAITLTPGTVTVDRSENKLFIIQMGGRGKPPSLKGLLAFERIIAPIKGGGLK